jgi:hypothetical protein
MNNADTARQNLRAACRLLDVAEKALLKARDAVAGVPTPAYGTRDVRFDALDEARQEVEEQTRNVNNCAYYLNRALTK